MKRKVLIITTTFKRWKNDGLPSFVYDFAQSIKEKCEVHVLAPHTRGAKKNEDMNGIIVHRFDYAPELLEKFGAGTSIVSTLKRSKVFLLLVPLLVISGTIKLIELQIKYQYDVIHVNWLIPFGPVVGFLRLFTKFRFIITSHGSDVFPFSNKGQMLSFMVNLFHRMFTFPMADHIVAVSSTIKNVIVKVSSNGYLKKITVISMGINYEMFANGERREILRIPLKIVFVGRLAEVKGVKYLIDAMAILRNKNIDFELQIFGDGFLRKSLEEQVDKYGLSEFIIFNGFIEHSALSTALKEFDIFIGPSITTSLGEAEGFGLVFLEAMAAGLVVISTNVGGIPDIVIDKETGILIEEKNSNAIAGAVEMLMENNVLRHNLINNGRRLSKGYDWANISDKYLQTYGIEK